MGNTVIAASPLDIPVRGWIPTTEKQPKKSGTYAFVTVAAKGRKKAFVTFASYWIKGKHHMDETRWASMDDEELDGVIAWMPMPDPYTPNERK